MSSTIPLKKLAMVWDKATHLYGEGRLQEAAKQFEEVVDDSTARISYNLGCIYLKLNENQKALQKFQSAVTKDAHFVATYVQMAALYLEHSMYDSAVKCYQVAIQLMGNKKYINYRPLGLNLILYLTEVLHNQAAAESKLDNWKQVEILINMAISAQQEDKFNNKLKSSLQAVQQKQQFGHFYVASGIFHPPKWMSENIKNIDYLGDSKVISTNSNPFSMNDILLSSGSNPLKDHIWPTLKEVEKIQQGNQKNSLISMLALRSFGTAMVQSEVEKLKSKDTSQCKPRQPASKPPSRPPTRPPTRPPPPLASRNRRLAIKSFQQHSTNGGLKCQDNTTAPIPDYKKIGQTVLVKYSLRSSNPNVLDVIEGDRIQVKSIGTDWFRGCLKNKVGLVAWNCIHQVSLPH